MDLRLIYVNKILTTHKTPHSQQFSLFVLRTRIRVPTFSYGP